jgi:hypothetical protein
MDSWNVLRHWGVINCYILQGWKLNELNDESHRLVNAGGGKQKSQRDQLPMAFSQAIRCSGF